MSDDQAALAAVSLAIAFRVVEHTAAVPGERALVLGAAGNVGLAVCSLLAGRGVRTAGQTGGPGEGGARRRDRATPVAAADPGPLGLVPSLGRDLADALAVGVPDLRDHEPIVDRHRHAEVHALVPQQPVAAEGHVDTWVSAQRDGGGRSV